MRQTKRRSYFYGQKNKTKVKQILERLSESYENGQAEAKAIHSIIEGRLRKIQETKLRKSSEINQDVIKPSRSIEVFSEEKPISCRQKFLIEKKRLSILEPERAKNSQPNFRGGSVDRRKMINHFNELDPKVVNKKFEEYIRVLDQQSGTLKKKRISDKNDRSKLLPRISPSNQSTKMKKTYFKRFPSDQFNFYKPPIQNITRIFELTSQKASLESDRSFLKSQSTAKNYKTIDIAETRSRKITEQPKSLDYPNF